MSEGVGPRRDAGDSRRRTLAAVAAGGAIGSLGRWAAALAAGGSHTATLLVNVTGAFTLGVLVVWLGRGTVHPLARPFLAVGLLGGWTTYSSFALDAHALAGEGLGGLLGYLLLTLGLGVAAAVAGLVVGDRVWGDDPSADEAVAEGEL
ncbi:CrcB family protein [Janibacter hoylei PVAS-1]|uniref:Fluoride-specific ion channel FluC n=1 Tax=Janibacter hoylei PVAS-1 TaxID=1210046 RepID=A0A444B3L9_9MICO|nr:CrcB family protein [Janibacter hoylei]RWU82990.1 CrcB family protein [Janibacter hoylei PVAS-1]